MLFGCHTNSTLLAMEDSLCYNQLHLLPPATEYRKIMFSVVCVSVSLFTGGGGPHATTVDLFKLIHFRN